VSAFRETAASGPEIGAAEHAVTVYLKLSDDRGGTSEDVVGLDALEDRLVQAIEESGVGEFDGIGRGLGFYDLYMYGPDADALFAAVEPLIRAFPARPGSYAVKRYGEPGASTVRVEL
jgi:hypothetical protein